MVIAFAAGQEPGALRNGFLNEFFQAREPVCGDHGADVDGRVVDSRAEAEGAGFGLEEGEEARVDGREDDDALDADAVLACGLEDAAEEDAGNGGEVGDVVEDDGGVFAAELYADWGDGSGGRC